MRTLGSGGVLERFARQSLKNRHGTTGKTKGSRRCRTGEKRGAQIYIYISLEPRPYGMLWRGGLRMNVHQIDRKKLLGELHAVEEKFPLRFLGLLPRGTAVHVAGDDAVGLLAEKLPAPL